MCYRLLEQPGYLRTRSRKNSLWARGYQLSCGGYGGKRKRAAEQECTVSEADTHDVARAWLALLPPGEETLYGSPSCSSDTYFQVACRYSRRSCSAHRCLCRRVCRHGARSGFACIMGAYVHCRQEETAITINGSSISRSPLSSSSMNNKKKSRMIMTRFALVKIE
jgi:hypothetical protein